MRSARTALRVVPRGAAFDYNVVFAQHEQAATAIALDAQGVLIASVVGTGFRAKGVTEGAAESRWKRMAAGLSVRDG
jgi:hypothetical protein